MANPKYTIICVNGVEHYEHRYVMEHHLGRQLCRKEVVHHLDGNRHNNSITNLEVMSLSRHLSMHNRQRTREISQQMRRKNGWTHKKACRVIGLYEQGISLREIAKRLKAGRTIITSIVDGLHWTTK